MKLINQSAQYLPQQTGIDGIYKAIELAGRTSYLSWDKMTDDSAKKFVDMLVKSKHGSVLEHGTVYLMQPLQYDTTYNGGQMGSWDTKLKKNIFNKYNTNPYSKALRIKTDNAIPNGNNYITTNLRVLQENGWLDDLKYLCEPTEFHEKRLSVKVITSRSISHELVRHKMICAA